MKNILFSILLLLTLSQLSLATTTFDPEDENYYQIYIGFQHKNIILGNKVNLAAPSKLSMSLTTTCLLKKAFQLSLDPWEIKVGTKLNAIIYEKIVTQIAYLPKKETNKLILEQKKILYK